MFDAKAAKQERLRCVRKLEEDVINGTPDVQPGLWRAITTISRMEDNPPPGVEYVERMDLRQGDVILLHISGKVDDSHEKLLCRCLEATFPGHKGFILSDGERISVVGKAAEQPDPEQRQVDTETLT